MAQNPKKFLSEVDFNAAIKLTGSAGTSGQVLTSGGVGVPTWTTAATANGASTIVLRDASGGFSAGVITGTSFNSLTGLSSTTPAAPGTAAVGTATTAARADHVHAIPTTVATTVSSTATADLITATMADNDYFRLRVGGTATDSGFVELATSDNGNEPIYIRQYSGVSFGTLVRTATILDGSGNTTFPGTVSGTTFSGSGASLTNVPGANVTGTLTSTVLGNSTHYIGNTAVALNRAQGDLALTGISSVTLPGSTSGTAQIIANAIAGTGTVVTLPGISATIPGIQFFTNTSNYTIATTTAGTTTIGNQAFVKTPTLVASTMYYYDAVLYVQSTIGTGSGANLQLAWGTGGGAGITGNLQMMGNAGLAALTTSSTTTTSIENTNFSTLNWVTSPTATQVTKVTIKGVIKTGATSPALYPVWYVTSGSPGTTTSLTTLAGSYQLFIPIAASGSDWQLGAWA